MKAILLGIIASFFFAVTFVLNQLMSDDGGSWLWSASLRYLFMIPFLFAIVLSTQKWAGLLNEIKRAPMKWLLWSHVGFGLFYAPLCLSASFSPAWLVAGTWQLTIIAGPLLSPFFRDQILTEAGPQLIRQKIPFRKMGMSVVILIGIGLMEASHASHVSFKALLLGILPIIIAAFSYPLGNRKMMRLCEGRLDAFQRTLGMTMMSLPLWLVMVIIQWGHHGLPSPNQAFQSFIVAVSSGVIATVLFFKATDLARNRHAQLAGVEATQAGEVVFALIGAWFLIPGTSIHLISFIGLVLVVLGMILHSLLSGKMKEKPLTGKLNKMANGEGDM